MDSHPYNTGRTDPLTPADARRLAGLVDEQHAMCLELEALSRAQTALVEGGDTNGVLDVLARRQQVIDRITRINDELAPMRSGRDRVLAALDGSERERVRMNIEAIGELVERVRVRDEHDREAMERRRSGIAGELSGLTRARGAAAAYANARPAEGPRFQDRRG